VSVEPVKLGGLSVHIIIICATNCELCIVSQVKSSQVAFNKQESPAIADKPARRESLPKIAQIRRAYNVVADNTGLSSFV